MLGKAVSQQTVDVEQTQYCICNMKDMDVYKYCFNSGRVKFDQSSKEAADDMKAKQISWTPSYEEVN